MLLSPAVASDCPRIRELARHSRAGFDPGEELERPFAKIWVVRLEPGLEPAAPGAHSRKRHEICAGLQFLLTTTPPPSRRGIES